MKDSKENKTEAATSKRTSVFTIAIAIFVLSGMAGLIYEVVWLRRLTLILGATAPAVSSVVSAYLFGLALGAYLFGRYSHKVKNPLRFYGIMEGLIGLYCIFTPLFFHLLNIFEESVGSSLPAFLQLPERFLMSLILMAIPTTLMGATLPALVAALVSEDRPGSGAGWLYAANTLGAASGAALAGYALIQVIGERGAIWLAALINISLSAFVTFYLAKRPGEKKAGKSGKDESQRTKSPPREDISQAVILLCVIVFGLSGFLSITYEVYWTRALTMLLGSTTYAFTTMLTAFILGLGLGSLIAARIADSFTKPVLLLGFVEIGIAATVLMLTPLVDNYPSLLIAIYNWTNGDFVSMNALLFLLAISLMIVPTILMGGTFPIISRIVVGRRGGFVRGIGTAYALNTLGGILGSLAATFVILPMPSLGTQKGILLSAVCNGLLGIIVLLTARVKIKWPVALGGAALVGILLVPASSPWDMKKLGSGVFYKLHSIEDARAMEQGLARDKTLYQREDSSATVMVVKNLEDRALTLYINGKPVASSGYMDRVIEYMLGHLPVILTPNPEKAAIVGLGTGITFGSVASHPQVNVTCAEISPAVIPATRLFGVFNHNVLDLKNARVVPTDGRNFLLHQPPGSFDLITSDPIHPFTAGGSSLYTLDYYKLCLSRLKPGGIFCQWLPLYQLSREDLRTILATFQGASPDATLWMAYNDAVIIGSNKPFKINLDEIEDRFGKDKAYSKDLKGIGIGSGSELAGHLLLGPARIRELTADAPLTTDNRPILEFSAPKSLFKYTTADNWRWMEANQGEDIEDIVEGSEEALKRFRVSRQAADLVIEGSFMALDGDMDGAARKYEAALKVEPENLAARSRLSEHMLGNIDALVAQGKYSQAKEAVYRILDFYPDNADALRWLARDVARGGDYGYARNLLVRAYDVEPYNADVLADLSIVQLYLNRTELAEANARKAIELEPDRARPYFAMGYILEAAGNRQEAVANYRKALAIDPNMPEARLRLQAIGSGR